MIYLHIVIPTYLPTYQPTLHIRTIYLPCQRIVPHNLLHQRSSYTLLIVTLQQCYRHNNAILVISTTEHRQSDLQTKIAIYLGLPVRVHGSENNNFVLLGLAINTENYVDSTTHSASQTLDSSNQSHHFHLETSFTIFNLSRRKQSKNGFEYSK